VNWKCAQSVQSVQSVQPRKRELLAGNAGDLFVVQ
jgi:hypothetical protein